MHHIEAVDLIHDDVRRLSSLPFPDTTRYGMENETGKQSSSAKEVKSRRQHEGDPLLIELHQRVTMLAHACFCGSTSKSSVVWRSAPA